jgi:fumarate hydratase class II
MFNKAQVLELKPVEILLWHNKNSFQNHQISKTDYWQTQITVNSKPYRPTKTKWALAWVWTLLTLVDKASMANISQNLEVELQPWLALSNSLLSTAIKTQVSKATLSYTTSSNICYNKVVALIFHHKETCLQTLIHLKLHINKWQKINKFLSCNRFKDKNSQDNQEDTCLQCKI